MEPKLLLMLCKARMHRLCIFIASVLSTKLGSVVVRRAAKIIAYAIHSFIPLQRVRLYVEAYK